MSKWTSNVASSFVNSMKDFFTAKGVKPSDIFIDDLYSFNGAVDFNKVSNVDLSDLDYESKIAFSEILKEFDITIKDKRQMLETARKMFDLDIVQSIIDAIYDDGFNSFLDEENDFKISYEVDAESLKTLGQEFVDEINKEINAFVEKFNIKNMISDIIPELCRDGEYAIGRLVEQDKGITAIIDDIDIIDTLPFYVNNDLAYILRETEQDGSSNKKLELINPENVTYFRLKYFLKKRIKLDRKLISKSVKQKFANKTGLPIPRFTRVCRPIFYSAIKTINNLKLIEDVNIIQEVSNVLKPEVIGIGVPPNTTSDQAKAIIRDYERRLNDVSKNIDSENLDGMALMNIALTRILLPLWGDGKGSLTQMDIKGSSRSQETRDSIQFIRNLIAISIGIPSFFVNIGETPLEKGQLIKIYSRWTKKLTGVQKCLADGVIDLVHTHLKYKNLIIKKSNIKVRFQSLVNGDILEDIDLMVAVVTALSELHKSVDEISRSDENQLEIDSEVYKEIWDLKLSSFMNMPGLLKLKDKNFGFENPEDEYTASLQNQPIEDEPIGNTVEEPVNNKDLINKQNQNSYNDFTQQGQVDNV